MGRSKYGPKGPWKGPMSDRDIEIFENLCEIQCTLRELAHAFSCCKDTLILRIEEHYDRDFSTVFQEKKDAGLRSLRRAQWQKAMDDKNTTMQIFLGKQNLGQSDDATLDSSIKEMIYRTRIGPDGEILSEVKNRTELEASRNFDPTSILLKENKNALGKPKPLPTKKKKAAKKKKTAK